MKKEIINKIKYSKKYDGVRAYVLVDDFYKDLQEGDMINIIKEYDNFINSLVRYGNYNKKIIEIKKEREI